jgi:hypothetical protein
MVLGCRDSEMSENEERKAWFQQSPLALHVLALAEAHCQAGVYSGRWLVHVLALGEAHCQAGVYSGRWLMHLHVSVVPAGQA